MNFGKEIINKIKEEKRKSTEEKQRDKFLFVQYNQDDCQCQVKFKDVDNYGIVLDYITLTKGTPVLDVDIINKRLEKQAEFIQRIITYLLEDFKLIEMDKMNKRAQLRSYPPYTKENSKFYYEIVIDEGTRAHFQRYQYSSSTRRFEKITSQFTLEIFERLINDLVEIICIIE